MATFYKIIMIALLGLPFSGCVFKHVAKENVSVRQNAVPVFIQMPENNQVFENISPLIFDSFVEFFELVGYRIHSRQNNAYTLKIIIKSLDPMQKYISPDVLLFHSTIKLELECQLLNYAKSVVASNKFSFYHLISKPKNPVVNSDFLDFEYRRMLRNGLPKIEQYFRPYLIGKR